ncbi:hypothetical protein KR018_011074, partial [Drosophila ironensis]
TMTQPIDPRRDEIRRYLERGSVLDSLTKIFIRVIKERPENPMEYIRNNIGVVRHQHDKYERLQQDLQAANEEIQRLRGIVEELQGQQPSAELGASSGLATEDAGAGAAAAAAAAAEAEPVEEGSASGGPEGATAPVQELAVALEACQIEEKAQTEGAAALPASANASVQADAKAVTT